MIFGCYDGVYQIKGYKMKTLQTLTLILGLILLNACGGGSSDPVEETEITHNGTTYDTVISPYTGKVWLDRNLGASRVCTTFDDVACYGDYYQWGRNFDGHQDSTSSTVGTQATDIDNVGHSEFITSSVAEDFDWAQAVDADGSLRILNWLKSDGTSVCPVGFKVPTSEELRVELLVAGSAVIQNNMDAFNSFLKLPSAGFRSSSDGVISGEGVNGVVLASSVNSSSNSFSLRYGSRAVDDASLDFFSRASGFSVRCLKE